MEKLINAVALKEYLENRIFRIDNKEDKSLINIAEKGTLLAVIRTVDKMKDYSNDWIPTTERLPEPDVDVLVTVKIRDIYSAIRKEDRYRIDTASYYELDNDWLFDNEYYSYALEDYDVIAWQPLPEPYQEVKTDEN